MTQLTNACAHCGSEIPSQWSATTFCCAGCQYVYRLIHDFKLDKYYELKPKRGNPLRNIFSIKQNFEWVETLDDAKRGAVMLHIEGVQCAACVWLVGQISKNYGIANVNVNTAIGALKIDFDPAAFQLVEYLKLLQEFGYQTSSWKDSDKKSSDGFLIRLTICAVIAMNSMMLSFSFYMGLRPDQPSLYNLFGIMNFILSSIAFYVGGGYFISRAYRSLRSRILHFDLPIALGIILVYFGSSYLYFRYGAEKTYFDTLNVFITLMLLGRHLQNRLIERNKNRILKEKTISNLKIKRKSESIEEIQLSEIRVGDHIYVSTGSIVPVDGELLSGQFAEFDLSWMSGESETKIFSPGSKIPSGSKLVSQQNIEIKAEHEFAYSSLASLFVDAEKDDSLPKFWQVFSKYYVCVVILLASGGFIGWFFYSGLLKALEVAVSVSVVTCPCALGIAIPLARSMANKQVMAMGIFIRQSYFLEKLLKIKKIIFDKTGTLTLSSLSIVNIDSIASLNEKELQILFNLVSRSQHPASQSIYQYLLAKNISPLDLRVIEKPGLGIFTIIDNDRFFLGRSLSQDDNSLANYSVCFTKNGVELTTINLKETIQDHTEHLIRWLKAKKMEVYQLSGDKNDRVQDMARHLGILPENSYGQCSPEKKGSLIQAMDRNDTLYLGDGLNDAFAFRKAFLSGVSLGNHVNVVDNCNFFFISNSLNWIPNVFQIASKLHSTIKFLLAFVIGYNVVVICCALMGWIGPLTCAIIMPASSLFVISVTTKKMNRVT